MPRRPPDLAAQPLAVQAAHTHCACSLPWPQLDHVGLDAESRAVWARQQQLARASRPPPVLPIAIAVLSLFGAALVFASRPATGIAGAPQHAVAPQDVGTPAAPLPLPTPVLTKQ